MKRAYEAFLLLLIGRDWVRFISQIIEIENTLDPGYMCVLCTYMLQLYIQTKKIKELQANQL